MIKWLSAESGNDLAWFWHVIFDGTRVCRCWRSIWMIEHWTGEQTKRQNACGNCDFCLLPPDVLIMRGELCRTTSE